MASLRSSTLDRPELLGEIRARWDDLATRTSNPYCAPAWMLAWWRHVAPRGARLRVHVVFDGEELVGLAPFFVDRGSGGLERYRLLAAGTSAPLDILARPGMEDAVAAETARWLGGAEPAPDVIMFEGLRGGSPWPSLLRAHWPSRRRPAVTPLFSQPAPFVELTGRTHAQWLSTKSSDFRRKLRREREAFDARGVTMRLTRSAEDLARDLGEFARLHHGRWRQRGGSGVLDARVERMILDAGAELVAEGRFRLWSMQLDGRVVSSHLFMTAGRETAYWLGGIDEEERRIERLGIGALLYALEHAFEMGDGLFDLGAGAQDYKRRISQAERSIDWVLLVPRGWRAPLARVQLIRQRIRQLLARRLPPGAKQLVRRALALASRLRGR